MRIISAIVALLTAVVLRSAVALAADPSTQATPAASIPAETKEARDARMAWFRDARFGMFIHWGLYSVPAGEWNGTKTKGAGEWIMNDLHIPVAEYEKLTKQFNPVKFDAKRWVQVAKDAGMKYIVITSKHHDGFSLFDSKVSDYDVMNTPFNRDVMKELSQAAHDAGITICWYHSIMDWHHPDAQSIRYPNYNSGKEQNPHFDRYVETYLKPQIKELLTNYGKIGILWFDGEWIDQWTSANGQDMYAWCRSIQPDVIVNNRVGKGRAGMAGMSKDPSAAGDYGTPEQQVPPSGFPGIDWETCMTMNDTWGFKTADEHWKSSNKLIHTLIDVASKGGNFLLNVGPTALGEIPPASVERLGDMGKWMKVNSEAIYGTTASPFAKALPFGRCTRKGNTLYLMVFDWPADRKLVVPLLNEKAKASLLADRNTELKVSAGADGLTIDLPADAPDKDASVIVLDVADELKVK